MNTKICRRAKVGAAALTAVSALLAGAAIAAPKVVVISLDGATPRFADPLLDQNLMPGLAALRNNGVEAKQNLTITPSLTAPGHIAIATGSTAANNDINSNSFHLVASPFSKTISGFNAPIGGYDIDGPAETLNPTAVPVWSNLLAAGKTVVTATFPGGDGLDVTVPGLNPNLIIQGAGKRTVTYTVPFGTSTSPYEQGFTLKKSDFVPASAAITSALESAGHHSYSPVQIKIGTETFKIGGASFKINVAAIDTTNDGAVNYDTLVFFDDTRGISAGPFTLPSTGPAYVKASDKKSSPFYLEGSSQKAGTAFYVTQLAPDLSNVHFVRYSAVYIPRNTPVINDVDDINANVGFWGNQSDYYFTERLATGVSNFTDAELEEIFHDQVSEFLDYQTRVALRAIAKNPNADLVMVYIEQPDGSEHQFLLTDPRQASNPTDPNSIGANQDPAKVARYADYVKFSYTEADSAVQRILQAVGTDTNGKPTGTDVFVVSDHGFDPFFTSVSINNLLTNAGISSSQARAVSSGPAVNVYINLQGREPDGTVTKNQYIALQQQIISLLKNYQDTNPIFTNGKPSVPLFQKVFARPASLNDPKFGLRTSAFIGQDTGDVFALLTQGYNFDGTQSPVVIRKGDPASAAPVLSVSNFYGAHGYDPNLTDMSAIFFAAGPDIAHGTLNQVHNIDIAPTVSKLLGVTPASTVQGHAINLTPTPLAFVSAASRKVQGDAGTFDIALPLIGKAGVEGRLGGPTTVVLHFNNNITAASATAINGTVGAVEFSGNDVLVSLSGVTDGQEVTVHLTNVSDIFGNTLPAAEVSFAALLGDVNGDGAVNGTDVSLVKAASSLGLVDGTTFREDVNANGGINAGDVAVVKASQGHTL